MVLSIILNIHAMYQTRVREKNTNTVDTNKLLADPLTINIVAAVDQAQLTFLELASVLRVSQRRLHRHLQNLLRARAIISRQEQGETFYAAGAPELTLTSRILYGLWGEEARRAHSRCLIAL